MENSENHYLCNPNFKKLNNFKYMLIVPVKEGESIERALKKYKKKFEKTGVVKELRERQSFTKTSVKKRNVVLRAAFREKVKLSMAI